MRYREAHRPAEIAQRIGWTAESVYVALSRARAALRECVGRKLAAAGVE
jgi:RNA polymerase sigma-70 factor (ECF subfamily)